MTKRTAMTKKIYIVDSDDREQFCSVDVNTFTEEKLNRSQRKITCNSMQLEMCTLLLCLLGMCV